MTSASAHTSSHPSAPAPASIPELFSLHGRTALVTGASRGLGAAMAEALAKAGADVILVARGDLSVTARHVTAAGRAVHTFNADQASRASIDKLVAALGKDLPLPDIVVNNAGTIKRANFTSFSLEDWDEVIETNLTSVFRLSQKVAKEWVTHHRRGKIIQIASLLSFQGGIRVASYTASKSALAGLTRLMSNELAHHGINVNAIAPGYMATDNTAALRADAERNKAILDRIPAGRWGESSDIIGALLFLASAASDYVHGHILAVDGGWLGR